LLFSLFAETIVNEHPVTIYPGPLPQKRVPPRTLPGSIERHRDVMRKHPSSDLSSSSSQELKSPLQELMSPSRGFILKDDDFIKRPISPSMASISVSPPMTTPLGIKISIQTMDNLMNNRNIIHNAKREQKMNMKNSKRNSQLSDNDDDEDKFSDDSLEDTSLPPPAPPPVIPPPPSLSAPVTPSKRHSIAWEVNLDDLCATANVGASAKVGFHRHPRVELYLRLHRSIFSLLAEWSSRDFCLLMKYSAAAFLPLQSHVKPLLEITRHIDRSLPP
jgi:hypothetical protein